MEFERALVVFAHPDDAEFLCGGTVARWTGDGTEVAYVCATDGSAGWNGPDMTREEIARTRKEEMDAAGDVLGVASVTFLGYPDGSLAPTLELRRDVTREVRRHRPSVIVAPDPSLLWEGRHYINHPDHRAVGEAVLAVVACDAPTRPQFPELLEEGFEPYDVPALWLPSDQGDRRVDITGTMDLKLKSIHAHDSQIRNMAGFDAETRVREWAARTGEPEGMTYAEAFRTFALREEERVEAGDAEGSRETGA